MTPNIANGHVGGAKARILVLSPADAGELAVLKGLPPGATVVGVGTSLQELQTSESYNVAAMLTPRPCDF